MANRIQLRRGGAQEWANSNPTLAQGELGIELDTGRFKIGDGVSAWNTLRYERPVESTSNTANTLVQRDADGNFSAGTITSTVIGNSSTASRLASSRQIQLSNEVTASGVFDGSTNLNLSAELALVSTLPHYDGTSSPSGTYNKVTVDAKGRITNAQDFTTSNNGTLADYGLDGTNEGTSAQPYDLDLIALAGLTTTGMISRTASNTVATRTITGTATRISVSEGAGISGNPTIDMITTAVTAGNYNTESLTSVSGAGGSGEPFGTATVNATKFTVDAYGRLTSATNVPIATAAEGSKYASYNAGTTYVRYDIIANASKVYQAITGIAAGAGAPTHSSGDSGGWRYLAAEATEQKGLASFAQEDFDVDANGHVTIATAGVDNTQLQNNKLIFTDGNAVENFELDNELTTSTANTGFNKLNFIKINNTSGGLLFSANNTGDSGAGEIDVNVRSYFSDPDITLDGSVAQTLDKTGDGNLTFQTTQNSSSARTLSILATNSGSGNSGVVVTAENTVTITASDAAGKVQVEDIYFQGDYIASSAATMILDPGDDRATSGKVQIMGDLQVDGTTTTINSTVTTIDDPIITLGGDTAPGSDDNKDRGVEFRYYDDQARLGFFGYDDSYTDLGGHVGGFTFLHNATNTSEVFSGTASGITAGNLKLTTNTNSTSNTTGDLVVAGGVGIGDDVNIGGLLDVDGTFRANSTSRFDDNIVFQGASKTLSLNNGSGTTKIQLHTTTGNIEVGGILTNTGAIDANSTLNVAGIVRFEDTDEPTVAQNGGTGLYEIQSNDYGSFRFDGGGYIEGDTVFNSDVFVNGVLNQRDSATESFGNRNYLNIRYKLRSGSSAAYTPSYASDNTSNLRIFGGAGIQTDLHIGDDLYVGKLNSGDTVKFEVLGESGNTTTQGTLTVEGQTNINDSLIINKASGSFHIQNGSAANKFTVDTDNGNTLIEGTLNVNGVTDIDADFAVRNGTTDKFFVASSTGNTNIEGTLTADGHTELNSTLNVDNNTTLGSQLTVTGNSEFNGTVDVDANFAVRSGTTDKMTVASASGNIATDGTLVVAGQTTINDSLIVQSDNEVVNINNGSGTTKFSIDTDNGNTNIIGTLTVGDATQINNTLGVSNVVTLTRNTQQTLTGSYAADGAFRLTGGAAIGKNVAIGEGLRVYGGTELTGALDLNNSADISGALVTHDDVTITADNKMFKVQNGSAANKFTVDTDNGNTDIQGTLDVAGDLTAASDLIITGNLTVNGTTTTVNSTVTTIDDPIITVGGDTAPGSNDGKDRGVEFRYYDGSAKIGFFGFDRSSSQFQFLTSATNTSEVLSGTDGALRAGSLNLTGAGTSLDVDANANIDGTLTVDGQIISQVTSGAALVIPTTDKINNLNADLLDSMTTATAATASTIVNRDASGDFAANQITAASAAGAGAGFLGNASTADAWKTARVLTLDGVVNGSVSIDGSAAVTLTTTYDDADITALAAMSGTGYVVRTAANTYAQRTFSVTASSGITLTNADGVSGNTTINVASTASNSANNLVLRDASGDFAANIITAALVGNVTGNLVAATSTAKNLNPAADSTHDLGSNTVRWQHIYADDITFGGTGTGNVTGNLTGNLVATTSTAKNLNPASDSAFDLGTSSVRWQNVYADAANITAITGTLTGTVSSIANHDTDALSEGSTNLYFTNERVDDRVNALITASTGITKVYDDAAGTYTLSVTQADINTDNVTEGSTNLFTTATRTRTHFTYGVGIKLATADLAIDFTEFDTDNITEGSSNLYYTDERVDDRINALIVAGTGVTKVYDDASNTYTLSVTQADVNTDTVTEGSTNLFTTAVRTRTHFTYGTGIELSGSGELSVTQADINTGNITEGSNLFYTDERVDDRVNALIVAGTGITKVYDDTAGTYTLTVTQADISTDNVTEGSTNLFTTNTRTRSHFTYGTGIALSAGGELSVTQADINTDNVTEGSTNVFFTNTRSDARFDVKLAAADTDNLSEGSTNQYYTEARVQAKLDNAYEQLRAMLTNLATSTTLTLGLSGDPTPGAVVTTGVSVGGGGGFTGATAVATSGGTGSGLTVNTTVDADGNITAAAVNAGGSDYLITDTVTITNANAGKILTLNLATLSGGTGYTSATGVAVTGGDGSSATVDITASGGAITNVTVNNGGTDFTAGNTITIANANASGIKTLGSISAAGSGYSTGTAIATSSSGSGSSATLNITSVDASGGITGVAINDDGSGYAASEVLTITNANASGIATTGNVGAADASRTQGTYTIGTSDYITQADGANATFTIVVDSNGAATITVTDDGSGFIVNETVTVADAQLGGGGGAALTFDVTAIHGSTATVPVSAIHGNGATVNVATVATNATLTLTDITTMEVGATVTGATSGTTGVITALGTNQVTVDNVDGFFKKGEVVSANDVTTLTISSFS